MSGDTGIVDLDSRRRPRSRTSRARSTSERGVRGPSTLLRRLERGQRARGHRLRDLCGARGRGDIDPLSPRPPCCRHGGTSGATRATRSARAGRPSPRPTRRLFEGSIFNPHAQGLDAEPFTPISETLVAATPLMLAGLGVGLGFSTGVFNIGGQGQLIAGAVAALWVGTEINAPIGIHLPLVILAGAVGGAVAGFIPGILKATHRRPRGHHDHHAQLHLPRPARVAAHHLPLPAAGAVELDLEDDAHHGPDAASVREHAARQPRR